MISASCAASSASCGEAQSDPAKRCTCGCEPEITAASDATSPSCAALITGSAGQDVRGIYLPSRASGPPEAHELACALGASDADTNVRVVMCIRARTDRKGFIIGVNEPASRVGGYGVVVESVNVSVFE